MSVDWPIVPLGNYCSKIGSGATPRGGSSVYLDEGDISLIRSQNIYNDGFKSDGLVYITEDAAQKLKNVIVEKNDVLLNITGDSVARVCLAKDKYLPARVNQHVAIIRPDTNEFDPRYLRYLLSSSSMQNLLLTIASAGATRNALTKNMIETLDVPKPPIDVQVEIANNLESLDKKNELNRQTNQTLEQIAQAIFKSWFVDFEPVKAKIQAKQNGQDQERAAICAISGKLLDELEQLSTETQQQLKTTAALFPDALVESELGEIPEGWGMQKVEDVTELAYGKALKKTDRVKGEFPVYGSGGLTGTHNELLVKGPGIIVGRKGTVGSLYWEDNPFFPIDTVFYVKCKNNMTLPFLFYLFQTLGLGDMNTDAAVPGLNRNNVYRLELPKFPRELVKEYTIIVGKIRDKIKAINDEVSTLEDIRDLLLPKLLSGDISLNNFNQDMEVAANG